ncbi:MAG TPA: sulfatase, partial [Polyangiaceae bacterium]
MSSRSFDSKKSRPSSSPPQSAWKWRLSCVRLLFVVAVPVGAAASCRREQHPLPGPKNLPSAVEQPETLGSIPAASVSSSANVGPRGPGRPLNVLLITVDSLRADMPWTGYPRKIAPFLTSLSQRAVVYTHAYSISSYTAKSVAGILSGRYPSTLYRSGWFFASYPRANLFFPEVLQEHGIRTLGWHSHLYFGRGKGLEQGFDEWQLVPGITFNAQTDEHVTSEKMTKLGIELLSKPENITKQFFAWAHYMDPHDEYKKHRESPDWGNSNRDRYDSEVFYTDQWIQKLVSWAQTQSWWKNTALIVTADHGEAFGEHGMWKHAFEIWEVLTRVPLMVLAPEVQP